MARTTAKKITIYECQNCQTPIEYGILVEGNLFFLHPQIDMKRNMYAQNSSEMGPVDVDQLGSVALCGTCLQEFIII